MLGAVKKIAAFLAFALAALLLSAPAASACDHAGGTQKIHEPVTHAAAYAGRSAVRHCCCERGSAHAALLESAISRPEPRKDAVIPSFVLPLLHTGEILTRALRPPDPVALGFAANFARNHRLLI